MKVGDLVRFIQSGKIVLYLGMVDGCYEFWHPKWQMCYFSIDNLSPENYEVL